jgi:hypothetical protein
MFGHASIVQGLRLVAQTSALGFVLWWPVFRPLFFPGFDFSALLFAWPCFCVYLNA